MSLEYDLKKLIIDELKLEDINPDDIEDLWDSINFIFSACAICTGGVINQSSIFRVTSL